MSAFGGNSLAFGLSINARDNTAEAQKSVLRGFASLATKPITIPIKFGFNALAALRDINLGLVPLVRGVARGVDSIIERGGRLDLVRKSFESLTGRSGAQMQYLARQLVAASNGTLRLGQAMEIANRGLASGLSLSDLRTTLDFISKKAATTGKEASESLDKVVTGLARGSTLFLDDFGILVDGVEGVKRGFDAIKGSGAFDQLGPAAQKAEIVRQAMVEMRQQMSRIGVSGKDVFFSWQGIKNQIGDAVDKLAHAAVKSGAVRDALGSLRSGLGGIARHFEQGGSISDILFGKKGGQSGGLFGVLKGGLVDLGEAFGRGVLYAVAKGAGGLLQIVGSWAGSIRNAFVTIWDEISPKVVGLLQDLPRYGREFGIAVMEGIRAGLTAAMDVLPEPVKHFFRLDQFKTDHSGERWVTTQPSGIATTQPAAGTGRIFPPKSLAEWGSLGAHLLDANLGRLLRAYQMSFGFDDWNREIGHIFPGQEVDKRSGYPIARGMPLNPSLFAMQAIGTSAMGAAGIGQTLREFIDWAKPWGAKVLDALRHPLETVDAGIAKVSSTGKALSKYADRIVAKGLLPGGSRAGDQWNKMLGDFPSEDPGGLAQPDLDPMVFALTPHGRHLLKREEGQLRHQLRRIDRGDFGLRQRAMQETNAAVRALREKNKSVSLGERRRMFQRRYEELKRQAREPLRQRLHKMGEEQDSDDRAREIQRRIRRLTSVGKRDPEQDDEIARRIHAQALEEFERTGKIATPKDQKRQVWRDEIIRVRQREGDWIDQVRPEDIEMAREYERKYGRGGFAHRAPADLFRGMTGQSAGPAIREPVGQELVKSSNEVASEIRGLRQDVKNAAAGLGAAAAGWDKD